MTGKEHEATLQHGSEVTNVWWPGSELATCAKCKAVIVSGSKFVPAEESGWRHFTEVYDTSWDPESPEFLLHFHHRVDAGRSCGVCGKEILSFPQRDNSVEAVVRQ